MECTAIVLMGHGSRVPGAGADMERVAARLKEQGRFPIVEACYMERQEPDLGEAFDDCVGQGATRIILIPYLLLAGLHLKADIPAQLQAKAREHPGVAVVMGRHLGFDELLVDLVNKRIAESESLDDIRQAKLAPRDSFVPVGGHHPHHA